MHLSRMRYRGILAAMLKARTILGGITAVMLGLAASAEVPALSHAAPIDPTALLRPIAQPDLPATRWDHRPEAAEWTRAALVALQTYGSSVVEVVPRDIETWCPAYAENPPDLRRAFWVGLMSAVAYYESRHIPDVVGGRNQFFGLMQIYPPTARSVGCVARTGEALQSGAANLACAVRILAVVVPDDQAIAINEGGWRGVANQWGPMTHRSARAAMSEWTREQDYCQVQPLAEAPRPPERPDWLVPHLRADAG